MTTENKENLAIARDTEATRPFQSKETGNKSRLDLILDGVDKHVEVTLSLEGKLSREEIRKVESAAKARGITACYDGSGFLLKKLNRT